MWHDFKHRKDPLLPAVPCQICGKSGHQEEISLDPPDQEQECFGFWTRSRSNYRTLGITAGTTKSVIKKL